MMYAEVATERAIDRTLTYHIPPELEGVLQPGHLVRLDLRTAAEPGIVIRIHNEAPTYEDGRPITTKPVLETLDPEPVVTPRQIALAQWMSKRYLSPLGPCLWLMLPPGLVGKRDVLVHLQGDVTPQMDADQIKIVDALKRRGSLTGVQLGRVIKSQNRVAAAIRALERAGIVRTSSILAEPRVKPRKIQTASLAIHPDHFPLIRRKLGKSNRLADALAEVIRLEDEEGVPPHETDILGISGIGQGTLDELLASGWVELYDGEFLQPHDDADSALFELRGGQTDLHILNVLARHEKPVEVSWIYAQTDAKLDDLKRLEQLGFVHLGEEQVYRDSLAEREFVPSVAPRLTDGQRVVWRQIREALNRDSHPASPASRGGAPPQNDDDDAANVGLVDDAGNTESPGMASPSLSTGRGIEGVGSASDKTSLRRSERWLTPPELWRKIKPLAQEKRTAPTTAENRLWQAIRNEQIQGYKFRRQHAIDRFIVDFYCAEARLIVEVDGEIHQYTGEEDALRQQFLESLGFRVIRFTNEQIYVALEDVLTEIENALLDPHPASPASRGGAPPQNDDDNDVANVESTEVTDDTESPDMTSPSPLTGRGIEGVGSAFDMPSKREDVANLDPHPASPASRGGAPPLYDDNDDDIANVGLVDDAGNIESPGMTSPSLSTGRGIEGVGSASDIDIESGSVANLDPHPASPASRGGAPPQNDDDNDVANVCATKAEGVGSHVFLLHGVTGSGKTEIYLRAIERVLAQGRQAILLVPEIALTAQTIRRVAARFPGQVAVVHSRLSDGERYDTWRRTRAGEIGVVIGARSALFTPLPDVGLVILDEEHDNSYKQSPPVVQPYYHARDVAERMMRQNNGVVILGSATPDVETMYRALRGRIGYLHLPDRIMGHRVRIVQQAMQVGVQTAYEAQADSDALTIPLPPVDVVDMRAELRTGNMGMFSRALQEALGETLARGEQAMLFLNRRGASTYVFCRDCGYVAQCKYCDMPMTYHAHDGRLHCHHCGRMEPNPKTCPACGSSRIRYFGAGTQEVENAFSALFPDATALRWDSDTASKPDTHDLILERFMARQADVLIGTQMIAKGLDLPLVTLVGVVSADVGLNMPDFRAGERTFQLLTQVAGRAGRGLLGGRVIVQTYQPDNYAVVAASTHDYNGFYEREIEKRREIGYPPFRRMARILFTDRVEQKARVAAERAAESLNRRIETHQHTGTHLIGPAPCFFGRINRVYRWQILLRGPDPSSVLEGMDFGPYAYVDVDPVEVL